MAPTQTDPPCAFPEATRRWGFSRPSTSQPDKPETCANDTLSRFAPGFWRTHTDCVGVEGAKNGIAYQGWPHLGFRAPLLYIRITVACSACNPNLRGGRLLSSSTVQKPRSTNNDLTNTNKTTENLSIEKPIYTKQAKVQHKQTSRPASNANQ